MLACRLGSPSLRGWRREPDARFAGGSQQMRLKRLEARRAGDLLTAEVGQVEDVDRALAAGGDWAEGIAAFDS